MIKRIVASLLIFLCQQAMADDWGCQVALCMANPAGPMALSECVAPIQRLYNVLAHHGSWPSCSRASAPSVATPQFNNSASGNTNPNNQPTLPTQTNSTTGAVQ